MQHLVNLGSPSTKIIDLPQLIYTEVGWGGLEMLGGVDWVGLVLIQFTHKQRGV